MAANSSSMELTLLVPGITRIDDEIFREFFGQAERLPGLEMVLGRGREKTSNTPNLETTLAELFGLTDKLTLPLPAAALSNYLFKGELNDNWYMHCDPVMVQVNREHLLLLGNDLLEISETEAQQIVSDINTLYDDQAWLLKMLSPKHWVLEMQSIPGISTNTLKNATGKKVNNYLPAGKDAAAWHALLNELQMFLHSHPVNQARESKGLPSINSVWFWGEGRLPGDIELSNDNPWIQCWTNHGLTLALASLREVSSVDCPDNAADWLAQVTTPGQHLVVIDTLLSAGLDPYDWWQALFQFDQQWLLPLIEALRGKKIARLILNNGEGRSYELTRALASRWWKRIKPLV